MIFMIVALALFAGSMTEEVDAETEAEQLAEMFTPTLILTEETGGKWETLSSPGEPVGLKEGGGDNPAEVAFSTQYMEGSLGLEAAGRSRKRTGPYGATPRMEATPNERA